MANRRWLALTAISQASAARSTQRVIESGYRQTKAAQLAGGAALKAIVQQGENMTLAEAFTTIFPGRARVSGRVSKPLVAARIGQLPATGGDAGEAVGRQAEQEAASCRVPVETKAETRQHKRRNQLEAENLASAWIKDVRAGHYAYRVLKDRFDAHCEAAGIDAVSDHRFGRWLASHGGEKYRANAEKTLMYKMPRRRAASRSGDRAAAARP